MEDDITTDKLEKIISLVGYGRFQRRFFCYALISICIVTANVTSLYQVLSLPDHWCRVPRPPAFGNLSIDEWKNLTIPKKNGTNKVEFEKCYMYNVTNYSSEEIMRDENKTITECQHGWEYDQTWYTSTIPSEEDWVCEREIYSVQGSQLIIFAAVCGQILLGLFSDKFGRRLMFLLCLVFLVIGRILIPFTTHVHAVFLLFVFIYSFPQTSIGDAFIVTGMELSSPDTRSRDLLFLSAGPPLGIVVSSLCYWAIGSFVSFYTVVSMMLVPLVLAQSLFVESPRWLINRRKNDKFLTGLKTICKYNRNEFPEEIMNLLGYNDNGRESRVRTKTEHLLCSRKMVYLFLVTLLGWIANFLPMFVIFLNVNDLAGNPYLSHTFLALVELPGYLLGKYFGNLMGRRFTRVIFSTFASVSSLIVIFIIKEATTELLVIVCCVLIKLFNACVIFLLNLHTSEIYPTSIRQSGLSLTSACGNLVSSVSPHIVYLGRMHDKRIPFIACALSGVLGAFTAILLPETLGKTLPESRNDTETLMKEHKIWTMPRKRRN